MLRQVSVNFSSFIITAEAPVVALSVQLLMRARIVIVGNIKLLSLTEDFQIFSILSRFHNGEWQMLLTELKLKT